MIISIMQANPMPTFAIGVVMLMAFCWAMEKWG
jgi:hypothetical protein